MKIRFTQDVIYETEGVGKGPRFPKGSEHDLREDLARRWLRRRVAEEVKAEPADAPPASANDPGPSEQDPPKGPDEGEGGGEGEGEGPEGDGEGDGAEGDTSGLSLLHTGGGYWHVVNAEGERLTEKGLRQEEAQAELERLKAEG